MPISVAFIVHKFLETLCYWFFIIYSTPGLWFGVLIAVLSVDHWLRKVSDLQMGRRCINIRQRRSLHWTSYISQQPRWTYQRICCEQERGSACSWSCLLLAALHSHLRPCRSWHYALHCLKDYRPRWNACWVSGLLYIFQSFSLFIPFLFTCIYHF